MSEHIRVYYLDAPLSPSELEDLETMTGWDVEQVRVPFLIPEGKGSKGDEAVPEGPLKAAGILKDYGKRAAFVQMSSDVLYWSIQFTEAIARLTGRWPYMVQTAASREAIGTQGELRVLDLDGAMRDF